MPLPEPLLRWSSTRDAIRVDTLHAMVHGSHAGIEGAAGVGGTGEALAV
jgi:hypothetical protein